MLFTCIKSPLSDFIISPGLKAFGPGIFSTSPIIPTKCSFTLAKAADFRTPATTAAPAISIAILTIPEDDFSDNPPESNTTPFPTSAVGSEPFFPPFHSSTTTLEGFSEPFPTAKSKFMPIALISFSFKTLTLIPTLFNFFSSFSN